MLRAMRNDFKKYSWTLWLVIFAFIGGFIVTDAFRGRNRAESGLIFIDGDPVIQGEEYQKRLGETLQRYKEQLKENFNKSLINQWGIPEQILKDMITNTIIMKEADNLNISASTDEVKEKIVSIPAFQQDGKFIGATRYKQILSYQKINITDFEEQLEKQIIGEKLLELVTGALVLDYNTLEDQFKKEKDQAELETIAFTTDRVKTDVPVSDADLSAYYEKHKEDFKSRERRAAYIIALKYADFQKDATVTPQEIYESFKTNKDEYRIPAKIKVSRIFLKYGEADRDEVFKRAEALQKELTKDNFADMARTNSQDDKAPQGGDYGYMDWKGFTHQEVAIIESLEQDQISTPVDTQQGFAILYVPEKIAERQQAFNEVKDKIEETIKQERVKQKVTERMQEMADKLGKSEDIKAKGAELGYPVIETQLLSSGQAVKDLDEMGFISRRMFALEGKEIAFPVQFAQGVAIMQISKIEEPTVEPLDKVKEQVKDHVLTAKKVELLKTDAANIMSQLNQMTDTKKIDEFLQKETLKPTPITYKRGNRLSGFAAVKGLDDQVFSMTENQYSSPLAFDDQVVIFKVKSKSITTSADFEKEKQDYYSKQLAQLQNTYFRSFIENKMQAYKVTQNQKLFEQIKEYVVTRFN